MILLGIDPGSTRAGYGIIDFDPLRPTYITAGTFSSSSSDKNKVLVDLYHQVTELMHTHTPAAVGMEKLFFMKNMKTATEVGQSRGVCVLAVMQQGIPLYELGPSEIKSLLTGYGNADKKIVTAHVKKTLHMPDVKMYDDAYDALAIALVTGYLIARHTKLSRGREI